MSPDELRHRLIRNFNEQPRERSVRPPLYDSESASLTAGTVATKLGAAIDVVAPGQMSCPYHCTTRRRRCSSSPRARARCVWRASACRCVRAT